MMQSIYNYKSSTIFLANDNHVKMIEISMTSDAISLRAFQEDFPSNFILLKGAKC